MLYVRSLLDSTGGIWGILGVFLNMKKVRKSVLCGTSSMNSLVWYLLMKRHVYCDCNQWWALCCVSDVQADSESSCEMFIQVVMGFVIFVIITAVFVVILNRDAIFDWFCVDWCVLLTQVADLLLIFLPFALWYYLWYVIRIIHVIHVQVLLYITVYLIDIQCISHTGLTMKI